MHNLTLTIQHEGTPCVPVDYIQTIFVDSSRYNIVTGDVEPGDRSLCEGDSFYVPFTLLDSTLYDSTNVFFVEAGILDADYNFTSIVRVAIRLLGVVPDRPRPAAAGTFELREAPSARSDEK